MNGGMLPFFLMAAAIALALSTVPWRWAIGALAGFALCAVAMGVLPISQGASGLVFTGFWLSTIAAAALVLIPRTLPPAVAIAAAVNAGAWFGGMANLGGTRFALPLAVPVTLFFVPGRWFMYRQRQIVLKVLASWLIAVSVLATFVSLVPTPGYVPDHME
jgi:hypothetical protein